MYKFCFVILHYISIEDTIECIESILCNVHYGNYDIIVVDNGSPNGSGKYLDKKYESNTNITIILNETNFGFSKGNNIGFKFAKNQKNADFISLINNDTIIKQEDFITKIIEKYEKDAFHILGPDIISSYTGVHQNPAVHTVENIDDLKRAIKLNKIKLFLNFLFLDVALENIKKRIFKKPLITKSIDKKSDFTKEMINVKLHGSCLVFSKEYIKNYDGLYPETFLFCEESILYYFCKLDNLNTIYYPSVKIYHKEDASINSVIKKDYLKRRFIYKNFIESSKILLKFMTQNSSPKE